VCQECGVYSPFVPDPTGNPGLTLRTRTRRASTPVMMPTPAAGDSALSAHTVEQMSATTLDEVFPRREVRPASVRHGTRCHQACPT